MHAEDLTRLEAYYARLRAGNLLDYDEAEDYHHLVALLEHDRPDDPGVWALVRLGAFLRGMMMGRGKEH